MYIIVHAVHVFRLTVSVKDFEVTEFSQRVSCSELLQIKLNVVYLYLLFMIVYKITLIFFDTCFVTHVSNVSENRIYYMLVHTSMTKSHTELNDIQALYCRKNLLKKCEISEKPFKGAYFWFCKPFIKLFS